MNESGTAAFFARVTASVSHELKNVMATVSESAGLLGDLLDASPDAASLDREELVDCCTTIVDEVHRGFGIIRNLNTFAHGADHPLAEVDLGEIVALASGIAAYLRRSCPVSIAPSAGEGARVRTNPILLLELLHRLLAAAFEVLGPGGAVAIETRSVAEGAEVRLEGADAAAWLAAAGPDVPRIAGDLGAAIVRDERRPGLAINLPADLGDRTSSGSRRDPHPAS